MGRLSFVGLGLGAKGVTLDGIEEMKSSDIVYLEYYTTPHEPRLVKSLQKEVGKELVIVDRGFVEDGGKILSEAETKRVALAVLGDPMIATTHCELRVRAVRRGVETKVVHGATIASAAASASGLHSYKFSRTVTVTRESVNRLGQVYRQVQRNLLEGSHSLVLLEYDVSEGAGVSPAEAVAGLLLAEGSLKRGVFDGDTFALVLSRVGREDAGLNGGRFADLANKEFGEPPHTLVIPGELHFTETESVSALFSLKEDQVRGNSARVLRTARVLVPRYVAKAKKALEQAKGQLGGRMASVVENADLYIRDAETHLANGDDELAMMSVGYAEGLLDSMAFGGTVKLDW